ncbi:MAG: hypothetical protein ACKO7W_11425 [Elainella sp.]
MLLSLLALLVAVSSLWLSRSLEEITGLLIKLIGLFSLLLSLVWSPWLIKLLVVTAVLVKAPLASLPPGLSPNLIPNLDPNGTGFREKV